MVRGRPFEPGKSPNPNGRPKKGKSLTDLLTTYLGKKADGDLVARKQRLAEELYEGAVGKVIRHPVTGDLEKVIPGDPVLLKYIFDRVDGKPDVTQRIIDETLPQVVIMMPEDDEAPE